MKKFMRHLSAFLIILLLSSLFIMPASAKTYSHATPDRLLDAVAAELGLDASPDALYEAGVITSSERRFFAQNHLTTFAVAWRIALPAFGFYPYPADYFPDIAPHPDCKNHYADARATAIYYGIADPDTPPNIPMTDADIDRLLTSLRTTTITDPHFTCPITDDIESWSIDTYKGRNAALIAYDDIPDIWLSDYEANEWSFSYQLPDCRSMNYDEHQLIINYHTAGLTSYKDRCIYLSDYSPSVILHEMAHYATQRVGWDEDVLLSYYNTEATSVSYILGAYAMTKPREYFAEFVSYWLAYPDLRPALESAAPGTAQLALQLVDHYDQLLYIDTLAPD